mmetsp:Transcript_27138/g.96945  ORF Transcript_27138/g.96945 Transcript_27138/m.96945 type:complete len:194 (-) Transcript_27138:170-751(-)
MSASALQPPPRPRGRMLRVSLPRTVTSIGVVFYPIRGAHGEVHYVAQPPFLPPPLPSPAPAAPPPQRAPASPDALQPEAPWACGTEAAAPADKAASHAALNDPLPPRSGPALIADGAATASLAGPASPAGPDAPARPCRAGLESTSQGLFDSLPMPESADGEDLASASWQLQKFQLRRRRAGIRKKRKLDSKL